MSARKFHSIVYLAILVSVALPAGAASVTPVIVDGNPTCADLGWTAFGVKVDPPVSGTYFLDAVNTVTISVSADGKSFDWTATIPIDEIIVKGGDGANVYTYDPEASSDTGLVAPDNASGGPAGLSHMNFCFDYEVRVAKTAIPSYRRTIAWTIAKAVTPDSFAMFNGDSGTATYTVTATKTAIDSDFAVSGTITIANPSPFTAENVVATDLLSDGTSAAVVCPGTSIAPFSQMVCTYTAALAGATNLTNTATVTTTGTVGGGTGTAKVTFGGPTTVIGPEVISVADSNGTSWTGVGASTSWSYARTFTCGSDAGRHGNTATIVETGAAASASVNVACYALAVDKSAATNLDRTFSWTLQKTASNPALTLSAGQVFDVTYTVALGATSADSNWAGHGRINVTNPAPIPATLAGVTDLLASGTATVECGVGFPFVLAPGSTLSCTWAAGFPNADARVNTATATLQNTPAGTTAFSGSALVDFTGAAVHTIDGCVSLADTYDGAVLPTSACVAAGLTQSFTYSRPVGPYNVCGTYTVENVASFKAADTGAAGDGKAVVNVDVVGCQDLGCTLTPGYWKTHSSHGRAPYDDTWGQVGEETIFFLSGQTYYQVLWTTPQGGNAYYILAHAWIAAKLNGLNGAGIPADVQEAFDGAAEIFADYTPAQIAGLKGSKGMQLRAEILGYASILDQYNNGLAPGGPPHCSE